MRTIRSCMIVMLLASLVWANPTEKEKQMKKAMKPALIVIDIQNEYLPFVPEREKEMALWMINGAIWLFREHGFPVIRVYHTDLKWGPKPDSEEFQFPTSVNIKEDDPKIIKNYPSAFKKTELETILREKGCNTLFLCGLSAVGCVLATYHTAMDLDFNVFMVKDGLMSHKSEYTDFIEEILDSVTFKTMEVMLDNATK